MYCKYCGKGIDEDSFYCRYCGKLVKPLNLQETQPISQGINEDESYPSTEVTDEDLASAIEDEYGVLYSNDGKRLLKISRLKTEDYIVRKGCEIIADEAFSGFIDLKSIHLPDSLKVIGRNAFEGRFGLKSINLPDGLEFIGNNAFYGCDRLESIVLPPSLKKISGNPFDNVWVENNSPYFKIENGLLIQNTTIIASIVDFGKCTIPSYITKIGNGAFRGCKFMRICPADFIKKLDDEMNYAVDEINALFIPNNLTHIGESAFEGCYYLSEVTIPDSVTYIDDYAFADCEGLQSVHLSNGLKSIGNGLFSECSKLIKITLPNGLIDMGSFTFQGSGLKEITIPKGVTSIGESTFQDCLELTAIKFPENLISIGNQAFYGDEKLEFRELPQELISIGNYAFWQCHLIMGYGSIINLPNNLKSIGHHAFDGIQIHYVKLPCSVTQIGENAFGNCFFTKRIYVFCPKSCNNHCDYEGVFWHKILSDKWSRTKADIKVIDEEIDVDENQLYQDGQINEKQYKWLCDYRKILEENDHETDVINWEMQVALDLVYQYGEEMENLGTPDQTYYDGIGYE